MPDYESCVAVTLKWEGGFVDNPHDPGGATNMGITIETLRSYMRHPVTSQDVRSLNPATAKAIYQEYYWEPIKGDMLPHGLDLVVFDAAVNSGPTRAIELLQGVFGIAQDGSLGPITDERIEDIMVAPPGQIESLIERYTDARLAYLKRLNGWRYFGAGWQARCLSVEHTACQFISSTTLLATASDNAGPPPGSPPITRSPRGTEAQVAPPSFWDKFTSLFKK